MRYVPTTYFAQPYGTCAYGAGTEQTSGCNSSTATSGSSGGVLSNTGFDIALIVTIACTLIFVALLVRFWKRKPTAAKH